MTTTISKNDLQFQQIQQQQTQQQQQHYEEKPRMRKAGGNQYTPLIATTTAKPSTTTIVITPTTTKQIDSLNNNNNYNTIATVTTPTKLPITPTGSNLLNNNAQDATTVDATQATHTTQQAQAKRRSFLNFKSFDFHLKSIYSGLRNGNSKARKTRSTSLVGRHNSEGSNATLGVISTPHSTVAHTALPPPYTPRPMPYLKIETVDCENDAEADEEDATAELLLDFPQSPYSTRRNSSHDDHRSSSQLLHINRYEHLHATRSQASSPTPSPYFLSPYSAGGVDSAGNIRRSSTSDINSGRRSGTTSTSDSRRPSTSDLLRRARERRGSEARMGRSVSHGGLPRGGFRSGCGGGSSGGRRTSMAF